MGEIYFVESGAGRPIVLLHGGLANHLAVRVFAEPLSARYRLITPDLRASGRSVHHGPLHWDLFADDVAELVRRLGLDRAVIGGVSFGAGVATKVALRHPGVVEALVILSPAFGGDELGLTEPQWAAMRAMDDAARRALDDGIEALFPLLAALPPELQARARAVWAGFDVPSVAALTGFMASGAQPFARGDELAAIDAPVLVVPGLDPTHPVAVAEVFRRHLRRCTWREAGPADYAGVIADFLSTT